MQSTVGVDIRGYGDGRVNLHTSPGRGAAGDRCRVGVQGRR
ncbi:hypothetical protein [Nocardia rhamnosiphila]